MNKVNSTKTIYQFPENGFLKLTEIIKVQGSDAPALIPVSRSAWLAGIKKGIYPNPIKLGARSIAWKVSDIKALIESLGAQ